MKRKVQFFKILFFAILSLTTIINLYGCGGGGSGGSSDGGGGSTTLSSTNAPQAGGMVIQAVNLVGPIRSLGELQTLSVSSKTSSETYSKPPLRSIIDKVIAISKTQRHKSEIHILGSEQATESCTDGGTITVSATWTGPDDATDESQIVDFWANMTFYSCKVATVTMNGSITVVFKGPLSAPSKITISTSNLTYYDTSTNDSITMTNLNMVFTDFSFSGDELTGATITLTGAMSGTVDGDPIDIEYESYKMVFNSSGSGVSVSLSGRIKASCLGGWVTVTTNTPIFVPIYADCPTAGEVGATSGGNSVKMVIASDSTITIYFNNTFVHTYNDCKEVGGLCVG